MTARTKHRLKEQIANIAAALFFVLAQFITIAHAEGNHGDDASPAHCALCCLVSSDDDMHEPPTAGELYSTEKLKHSLPAPVAKSLISGPSVRLIARGPPLN